MTDSLRRQLNVGLSGKIAFFAVLMLALLLLNSRAAFADDIIKSVSVSFKDVYGEPGEIEEPEVSVSGSNVEITDIDYRKTVKKWLPGVKIRANVRLHAVEGEFAENFNRGTAKVSGATFVGVNRIDEDTLVIKVDYTPVVQLENTSRAGWNSARTRAVWRKVSYAPGYNVELYADDKKVKSFKNIKATYLDLSDYMTDSGKTYFYEVKAVATNSNEKKYIKDGEFVTSEDETVSGGTGASAVYTKPADVGNGVIKNAWRQKNDRWYYINGEGNPATGWLNLSNVWYYMDSNGAMLTGWRDVGNGQRCYFNEPNGDMAANRWVRTGNDWYYVDGNGYMQRGWLPTSGNLWYYMDPASGRMSTGWVRVGDSWYLMGQDGIMQTGWQNSYGRWYYMDTTGNGAMLTGWQTIGDKRYYFEPADGHMLSNTVVDGVFLTTDGSAQ